MSYEFLVETLASERLKTLSVWSQFRDEDLPARPHPSDRRGRSFLEHLVHQCVSEDLWFREMLGIDAGLPPLPEREERVAFLRHYAEASGRRLAALRACPPAWWEGSVRFFDVERSRAWVVVRRIAHTAHHRGQQTALLRVLGRDLHSTYGPTADTGGLMGDRAPTIYPYPDLDALLEDAAAGRARARLPAPTGRPVTERPDGPRGRAR
jgi:uncharacterized damage-inducible protein DinB